MKELIWTTLSMLAAAALAISAEQTPSDRFYHAIRDNDLAAVRALLKTADANTRDTHGTTPLMYAAAVGSIDAMSTLLAAGADARTKNDFDVTALLWCTHDIDKIRLLLSKGADINARSKQGRSALLIAASQDGSSQIVSLLLEKGADLSVRDGFQFSPLIVAADANDTATAKLLLNKGANVNVKTVLGDTPLMFAAGHGNVELVKLLLAAGADVNATGTYGIAKVKNGDIALGPYTALLAAVPYAGPDVVKMLLAAGANINAQDARGMTPLMLAIATDRPDPRVVRLLLEKGADRNLKSKDGETAAGWAQKFSNPEIFEAMGMHSAPTQPTSIKGPSVESSPTAREAVEKSIPLLQRASGSFLKEGGCVSCHAQNLTGMAVTVARANGVKVDESAAAEQLKAVKLQWAAFQQPLLQRIDPPGEVDVLMYSVLDLSSRGVPADPIIDAIVHNIAAEQRSAGNWHEATTARPPMEDGDFSRTAISIRALAVYAPAGRKAEFDRRIQRASAWLASAAPLTTEDLSMQLLGQCWAGVNRQKLQDGVQKLLALQRGDGGWSQTPSLVSDAYATGMALYTLHEMGVPANHPAFRRGTAHLLRSQLPDGSWHVSSRAPKFQPYFQSGFPHDHDQWISASATAWSTMALSYSIAQ